MKRSVTRRGIVGLLAMTVMVVVCTAFVGCSSSDPHEEQASSSQNDSSDTRSGITVKVASLKGPTSIGLAKFMDDAETGTLDTIDDYEFSVSGTPDEILPAVIKGTCDIALIPANAASVLYNKTEGEVSVIDINTLGVLSVVTGDDAIHSLSDLEGRTVYMTGKGATPEYVMNYLLSENGLDGSVSLEFKSEATEVAGLLSQDPTAIGILPQPYVTAVCAKTPELHAAIDLTDEWDAIQQGGGSGSRLVTGVTIVRNEFLERHPETVAEFLEAQADSVDYVAGNAEAAAPLVVKAGIIDNESIAAKAIPSCNLVCLTGGDMKQALSRYLDVLHSQNASSVGGGLPDDDFYYGA